MANTREGSINEEATGETITRGNPTMVSLDYTRSAKSVITVAMIAVRFIQIGPQSMRMRAVKMKPMPMKFLVWGRDQGGRGQRGRGQGNHDQGGHYQPELFKQYQECRQGIRKPVRPIREFYRLSAPQQSTGIRGSADFQICEWAESSDSRPGILTTLYSPNEAVTLAKKVESQQNRTNTRSQFSNRGKQPVPSRSPSC
ncbi:hypothetical protein Acr_11g0010570 [Actinidia rufa]|uniref:Uncharacterized protein n=1 Tax=Actinidia rufa TaxID=165716 RepID=A0A7J0FDI7_9ERIC|nr:hypothetical protein Acr_11g0010570 [Actinidia rufa]